MSNAQLTLTCDPLQAASTTAPPMKQGNDIYARRTKWKEKTLEQVGKIEEETNPSKHCWVERGNRETFFETSVLQTSLGFGSKGEKSLIDGAPTEAGDKASKMVTRL